MPDRKLVHVVDDDEAMRESLAAVLQDAGYEVRTYARAEDFLAAGAATRSGCVVSDVRMPGMDGLALLRRLRQDGSTVPLVMITGHGDVTLAVAAMKAGAADFLEKPFEPESLLAAVAAALPGQMPGGGATAAGQPAGGRLAGLTRRELEVLERVIAGDSNKEVAAKLGLSPRTVEFHRAHIMEKTGARGLPDLVRFWIAEQPPLEGGGRSFGEATADRPRPKSGATNNLRDR